MQRREMVAPASVGIHSGRWWRNKKALATATVARKGDVCCRADTGGWFGDCNGGRRAMVAPASVGIDSGRRWRNKIALAARYCQCRELRGVNPLSCIPLIPYKRGVNPLSWCCSCGGFGGQIGEQKGSRLIFSWQLNSILVHC